MLLAAAAGLAGAMTAGSSPDARALDRLTAVAKPAAPPRAAPSPPPTPHEEGFTAVGAVTGSLYDSAVAAGATPELAREAAALFGRKLDVARDVEPGEPFRLVFDRTVSADGRTLRAGPLLYAEIGAGSTAGRYYRFVHDGGVDYLDAHGRDPRPLLLRTPVEGAHVTSGFGMRLHPILGFTRFHPGVDFGAPEGSPVLAAGDGVVEQAEWAGGYGRWLKIGHAQGFETGYGHLLRYAPGVGVGSRVEQGEVVAFVGSSGLSTGPHLHFEIMHGGEKLDPATVPVPAGRVLDATAAAAFAVQKAAVDARLAAPGLRAGLAPRIPPHAG